MMTTIEVLQKPECHFLQCRTKFHPRILPVICLEEIFKLLDPKDLFSCMLVCRQWYSVINSKGNHVWQQLIPRILPKAALEDANLLLKFPDRMKLIRSFMFAWNPHDISNTMYVKPDGFTVYRKPIAQCTDAVRGKRGVTQGVHAFEFVWHSPFGTAAVVGFSTAHERLHCQGYESLLGHTDQSWGWNLVDKELLHKNIARPYPANNSHNTCFLQKQDVRITLILDCDRKMAGFEHEDEFLGIAFKDLPSVPLYPTIAAVYGHSEISMYYMGPAELG